MFRSFWVIVIAVVFGAIASQAWAEPGKPLSDADKAEAQNLVDSAIAAMNNVNSAVQIASTDTAKACELGRTAEQQALDVDRRAKALRDHLIADGKPTEGVEKMVSGSAQLVEGTHTTARGLCDGSLAKTGDPATDAMIDKLTRLSSTLMGSLNAGLTAEKNGDKATACADYRVADTAYGELYDFLIELRRQVPDNSTDAIQFDQLMAKIGPIKPKLAGFLTTCPA